MRLKAAMWLPASTDLMSVCPPVCLSVCLSIFIVREGLSWRLDWAAVKHAGRMWSFCTRDVEGFFFLFFFFLFRQDKKSDKKILVVYNLICFHGFVFMARVAKQLGPLMPCVLWESLTTWQNQLIAWGMADGTCIVLYWNILHEARILTIKMGTCRLVIDVL